MSTLDVASSKIKSGLCFIIALAIVNCCFCPSDKPKSDAPEYKGPSVLSYQLDGRKAIYLPVPVYKCYGGGDVYVQITVNKKGYVTNAQIIESASTPDECLHKYAIEAAKKSRFTAKSKAPDKQIGEIVYRFIAQ
mgnify:CR=1 FL=1